MGRAIRLAAPVLVLVAAVLVGSLPHTSARSTDRHDLAFVASTGIYCPTADYRAVVLADTPSVYYRLAEASGTAALDDSSAGRAGVYSGTKTLGRPGAIECSTNTAVDLAPAAFVRPPDTLNAVTGPSVFTIEAWFQTSSARGGRIVGFGNQRSNACTNCDRLVHLSNTGAVVFGVAPGGTVRTVQSTAGFNDGQWHHVVATLSGQGMRLYLDGLLIASRTDTTTARSYNGFWRVGADNYSTFPAPSDKGLAGRIDEAAVYPTALTAARVLAHHDAGRV